MKYETHHATDVQVRGVRPLILRHALNTSLLNPQLASDSLDLRVQRIAIHKGLPGNGTGTLFVRNIARSIAHPGGLFEVRLEILTHSGILVGPLLAPVLGWTGGESGYLKRRWSRRRRAVPDRALHDVAWAVGRGKRSFYKCVERSDKFLPAICCLWPGSITAPRYGSPNGNRAPRAVAWQGQAFPEKPQPRYRRAKIA